MGDGTDDDVKLAVSENENKWLKRLVMLLALLASGNVLKPEIATALLEMVRP